MHAKRIAVLSEVGTQNGEYRTLCLRPVATIRDAGQVAMLRPGVATASIPAPA
jgi:hypothetical protein